MPGRLIKYHEAMFIGVQKMLMILQAGTTNCIFGQNDQLNMNIFYTIWIEKSKELGRICHYYQSGASPYLWLKANS